MIKNVIEDIYRELTEKYTQEEWRKKFIVLFGMNTAAQIEVNYFLENNISVSAIVDNDMNKQGNLYRDILISSPQKILGGYREDAIIIIASSAYDAIKKELEEMGYHENTEIYQLKSFAHAHPSPLAEKKSPKYREMTLREIQLRATQILVYVRNFCMKHDLRYFIAYGSLLGAARHQGFIPWDDDIDILMPFPDYLRFCELFQSDREHELISMHNTTRKPLSVSSFTKVVAKDTCTLLNLFPLQVESGVGIDIFPMNGYPDVSEEQKKYDVHLKHLFQEWADNVLIPMATPKYNEAAHQACYNSLLEEMTRYPYDESSYVGSVAVAPYNHLIAPKSCYENTVKVTFEGEEFDAPSGWRDLLKMSYGDWQKLPPEDKRKPSHFFHTYHVTG